MAGDLQDKVVAITGGGRGIGRATALLCAAEGAKVVVADFGVSMDGQEPSSEIADEVVAEITAAGGEAVAVASDVSTMEGGAAVSPFTYLGRAFERSTGAEPFRLPERWMQAKDRLDPRTPFNLSTNNDIVGGNSGSPLINARGELVGLIFDGNIHSISGTYWFDAAQNRSVAVHPAIIKAALTEVYGAREIAAELGLK